MSAREALAGVAAALPPVGLPEVLEVAELQSRTDRKYLLDQHQVVALAPALAGWSVLEIDGLRSFRYASVYFDTPDLVLFRAHRQGRRHRWKARTRTYLDSGTCTFEVKTKGRRGRTVKARRPHAVRRQGRLDEGAHAFLASTLADAYDQDVPPLLPALTTSYRRTTFVDLAGRARATCDLGLRFEHDDTVVEGPDKVLLETKSSGRSRLDDALARVGARPLSMSKYCLGTALTRPHLAANPWHRLLTREFGWQRLPAG